MNEAAKASRIYGMLTNALRSVYNLNPFLNRTTRVAPEHELGDFKIESGKLMLGNDVIQPATSEDVHLLCKLLHKHLENITTTAAPVTTTTATTISTTFTSTSTVPSIPKGEETTEIPTTTPFSLTTDSSKREHSKSSTPKPSKDRMKLSISDPNRLGEAHEDYLLESVFAYDIKQFKNNETLERVARHLLIDLFDSGGKRAENGSKPAVGNEYENDEEDGANAPTSEDELSVGSSSSTGADRHHQRHHNNKFKIKVYDKYSHVTSDKLHLVYWLLKRAQHPSNSNLKFQVLDNYDAGQLVDRLEHAHIERCLSEANLKSIILLASYKLLLNDSSRKNKHEHDHEIKPHLIDDSLNDGSEREQLAGSDEEAPKKNAFQLLVNKLTSSNFIDNLQLFGIIFVILLMCLVLCFACPLLCFKPAASSSSTKSKSFPPDPTGSNATHSASKQASRAVNQQKMPNTKRRRGNNSGNNKMSAGSLAHNREVASIEGQLKDSYLQRGDQASQAQKASDAIWRKLSNTTTTLIKDQSEVIMVRNDGTVRVPVLKDRAVGELSQPDEIQISRKSQSEWYAFDEEEKDHSSDRNKKQPQSFLISDKKQITKSIQTTTFHEQPSQTGTFESTESYSESLNDYKDKIETRKRSSDTLTKSELVMLKEKMIPIAQQRQQHYRQVASQTSTPSEAIYVNQALTSRAVQTGQSIEDGAQQFERQQVAGDNQPYPGQSSPATSGGDNSNGSNKRTPPLDKFVSSFIDSSESRSDYPANKGSDSVIERLGGERERERGRGREEEREQNERIPKMRHLDLPPRTRSKVDAIKAELSKLEQRDKQQSSSTSGHSSNKDPETCSYRRLG